MLVGEWAELPCLRASSHSASWCPKLIEIETSSRLERQVACNLKLKLWYAGGVKTAGSSRGSSRLGRLFPNSTLFIHLLGVILNIQENTVLEIPKLLEIVKLSLQMET